MDGASTRFRVLQWQPHLALAGFDLHLESFFSNAASNVMYTPARPVAKLLHLLRGVVRRCRVLMRLSRAADVVFVHRETFPLGWPLLLNRLKRFRGVMVYDYDDAMFLPQRAHRGVIARLERLDTPSRLMAMSDIVLAGNPFLAAYARQYSENVVLLPTCIDTDRFRPGRQSSGHRLVVGWIGSHSTSKYIETLMPALERVAAAVSFELYVVGCSNTLRGQGISIVQRPWALEREVEDFQQCDVGIYPLWDDDWSRGKSGFKAIQFMACGVPVVASGVGVTQQIIEDGRNGFIAMTPDDWVGKLTRLLSDAAERRALGDEGRRTIEAHYSVRANAPILIGALRSALDRANAGSDALATADPIAPDRPS